MRALNYFVDEALASLSRRYKTALIASATIAAALFVLGAFLVVTTNMQRLFSRWQEAAEVSVYLQDDSTTSDRSGIETVLRNSPVVRTVEFVSKEEALRRFKQNFSELAAAATDLPANPLPASVEVKLAPSSAPADVEALAGRLSKLRGVADVRYDRQWIERLMSAGRLFRVAGLALALVLIVAAALTVASVVRLALVARSEEIHIMQLVGAPLTYIRGPFVLEGLIQGGAGAILALMALWMTYLVFHLRKAPAGSTGIDLSSAAFLSVPMCLALLIGGMAVGSAGGFIAARGAREVAD